MSLSHFIRSCAVLTLLLGGTACASWQPHDGDPVRAIRTASPDRARLRLAQGGTVELDYPMVVDSMVVGRESGGDGYGRAVPISAIAGLETSRAGPDWMAGLIAGAVAAAPFLIDMMARGFGDLLRPTRRPGGY